DHDRGEHECRPAEHRSRGDNVFETIVHEPASYSVATPTSAAPANRHWSTTSTSFSAVTRRSTMTNTDLEPAPSISSRTRLCTIHERTGLPSMCTFCPESMFTRSALLEERSALAAPGRWMSICMSLTNVVDTMK